MSRFPTRTGTVRDFVTRTDTGTPTEATSAPDRVLGATAADVRALYGLDHPHAETDPELEAYDHERHRLVATAITNPDYDAIDVVINGNSTTITPRPVHWLLRPKTLCTLATFAVALIAIGSVSILDPDYPIGPIITLSAIVTVMTTCAIFQDYIPVPTMRPRITRAQRAHIQALTGYLDEPITVLTASKHTDLRDLQNHIITAEVTYGTEAELATDFQQLWSNYEQLMLSLRGFAAGADEQTRLREDALIHAAVQALNNQVAQIDLQGKAIADRRQQEETQRKDAAITARQEVGAISSDVNRRALSEHFGIDEDEATAEYQEVLARQQLTEQRRAKHEDHLDEAARYAYSLRSSRHESYHYYREKLTSMYDNIAQILEHVDDNDYDQVAEQLYGYFPTAVRTHRDAMEAYYTAREKIHMLCDQYHRKYQQTRS